MPSEDKIPKTEIPGCWLCLLLQRHRALWHNHVCKTMFLLCDGWVSFDLSLHILGGLTPTIMAIFGWATWKLWSQLLLNLGCDLFLHSRQLFPSCPFSSSSYLFSLIENNNEYSLLLESWEIKLSWSFGNTIFSTLPCFLVSWLI